MKTPGRRQGEAASKARTGSTPGARDSRSIHPPAGFDAREASTRLLHHILAKSRPLDEALGLLDNPEFAPLAPSDRAFARAIASMALRRKGQIDDALARFVTSPLPDKRGRLDQILLTAGAQLLFMNTPAHAAINIAVAQTRADHGARRFASLVNAVLRSMAAARLDILTEQDAAHLNTPGWLWRRWCGHYGEDAARAIAAQHLLEPPLDLTVKSDADSWAARLDGVALPSGSLRLAAHGRIEALDGYTDGEWWVQDAAAALPARLLGDVSGLRVADLCAAPGGKTAQLSHAGAQVVAVDQSPKRLARLRENLSRLGLDAETAAADVTTWRPDTLFDAVLLDAPCTATGTIRRHPDIAHLKTTTDLEKLVALQVRLLDNAAQMLRTGGRLVYCSCSLEPEEGMAQVEGLLSNRPDFALEPIHAAPFGWPREWVTAPGVLRTLPHLLPAASEGLSGIDGFFAARLRKIG